jgi:E3 ubiquitin-protein ligase MARCH6
VELATLAERRREGVFIPLDSKGAPRTEADKIRLLKQDRAARKAGRNPKDDYTVVTLPDFWRTRVYALLAFMLFSAACVTAGLIFVPLAIGRQVTAFWFDEVVYDGYSWVGFPPDDADLPDYRHLLVSDLVQHGAERQEAHH